MGEETVRKNENHRLRDKVREKRQYFEKGTKMVIM